MVYEEIFFVPEGILFLLNAIFEDQYTNININASKTNNIIKEYQDSLPYRIEIMATTQFLKCFTIYVIAAVYLLILYFALMYNSAEDFLISLNLKYCYLNFHLILIHIISDIVPYLFIYPYISEYTSVLCMPVHWNISQYLIILGFFLLIKRKDIMTCKSFSLIILLSSISFILSALSFTFYFYTRGFGRINYFDNYLNIIPYFFAPMLKFLKDYSIQKFIKSSSMNPGIYLLIVWSLEEAIYLFLRKKYIGISFFFEEINKQTILLTILSTIEDIYKIIAFLIVPLHTLQYSKAFSKIAFWILFFFGLSFAYIPYGYVIFCSIINLIDLGNCYLIDLLIEKEDPFESTYDKFDTLKIKNENIAENIDLAKTDYSMSEEILEKRIIQLEREKKSIEDSKSSLNNEIQSIKNKNSELTNENNKLKFKNKKMEEENKRLIDELANLESEIANLRKG